MTKRTRVPDGANRALPCTIDGCDKPRFSRAMCEPHYRRTRRHGDPHHVTPEWRTGPKPERSTPMAERFWSKVDLSNPDGCWPWAGSYRHRYGEIWLDGTTKAYAHRVAASLIHGELDDGAVVLHACDNPACVRPDHLRVGTQADNMADQSRKGRWRNQFATGPGHPDLRRDA